MPSPESPANRITARSSAFRDSRAGGGSRYLSHLVCLLVRSRSHPPRSPYGKIATEAARQRRRAATRRTRSFYPTRGRATFRRPGLSTRPDAAARPAHVSPRPRLGCLMASPGRRFSTASGTGWRPPDDVAHGDYADRPAFGSTSGSSGSRQRSCSAGVSNAVARRQRLGCESSRPPAAFGAVQILADHAREDVPLGEDTVSLPAR